METHELVARIESKADLVTFIEALVRDLREKPTGWENPTLEGYLSALARWLEDSDGVYQNQGRPIPANPSWRNVGEMLIAATIYE